MRCDGSLLVHAASGRRRRASVHVCRRRELRGRQRRRASHMRYQQRVLRAFVHLRKRRVELHQRVHRHGARARGRVVRPHDVFERRVFQLRIPRRRVQLFCELQHPAEHRILQFTGQGRATPTPRQRRKASRVDVLHRDVLRWWGERARAREPWCEKQPYRAYAPRWPQRSSVLRGA